MSHTPGPWHWDSDPIKGDPLDRRRYRVTALGRTITQVYYTSEWSGQSEADARLISAAPELLDALIKFTTAAKSWHDFHHKTDIACDLLCECIPIGEAALVKALLSAANKHPNQE